MTHIEREKIIAAQMVAFYCRKNDESGAGLCPTCRELLAYAHDRLDRCPYRNDKPSCKRCSIHCYKPDMRERMRAVMRLAGSRMLFHHPVTVIRHLFGK